jgi:hypothetical protein
VLSLSKVRIHMAAQLINMAAAVLCNRVRLLRAALDAADQSAGSSSSSSSSRALKAQLEAQAQSALTASQAAAARSAQREADLLDELQRLKLENLALASSRDKFGRQQQGGSRGDGFSEIEPFEVESTSSSMSSRACGDYAKAANLRGAGNGTGVSGKPHSDSMSSLLVFFVLTHSDVCKWVEQICMAIEMPCSVDPEPHHNMQAMYFLALV